jgi:hypothetical protein
MDSGQILDSVSESPLPLSAIHHKYPHLIIVVVFYLVGIIPSPLGVVLGSYFYFEVTFSRFLTLQPVAKIISSHLPPPIFYRILNFKENPT